MPTECTTIRAVRYHEYGDPSVLRVDEVDRPALKPREVLVRVRATGVHPMDWKLRAGYLTDYMPLQLPHVPGWEFAGTVEEVGEGVTGFGPCDDVFGKGQATYAEHAVAPLATLAKKPAGMSFAEAATLGVSGVTAWRVMRFETVFLRELGYRPVLDRCANCQGRLPHAGLAFSAAASTSVVSPRRPMER